MLVLGKQPLRDMDVSHEISFIDWIGDCGESS